jgi:DNA-binding CsgD family transcriptional regulator
VALGSAIRRANRASESREPLQRGLELAQECGATPLVHEAEEELAATGIKRIRGPVVGLPSLTASERRVARLASEGASNREIAQGLYLTLKTIETHLSNAYRKLGIASRRELAQALNP